MRQECKQFVVVGRGEFPWDMLRYDNCWPYGGEDAAKLTMIHQDYSDDDLVKEFKTKDRSIKLSSFHPPTPGRWSSFGWVCSLPGEPLYRDHR